MDYAIYAIIAVIALIGASWIIAIARAVVAGVLFITVHAFAYSLGFCILGYRRIIAAFHQMKRRSTPVRRLPSSIRK